MPNYIVNKLKISGKQEEIKKVLDFIKADDGFCIDFNKITPMPKWVFHGNLSKKEEEKYGKENCWYEWRIKNWGTKWNALEAEDSYYLKLKAEGEENTIYFKTAWSGVPELISKLGFIFPSVVIDYYWYDEDFGSNVGHIKIKDTEVRGGKLENLSPEAFDLACEISNMTLREHGYNEHYEYIEEE